MGRIINWILGLIVVSIGLTFILFPGLVEFIFNMIGFVVYIFAWFHRLVSWKEH